MIQMIIISNQNQKKCLINIDNNKTSKISLLTVLIQLKIIKEIWTGKWIIIQVINMDNRSFHKIIIKNNKMVMELNIMKMKQTYSKISILKMKILKFMKKKLNMLLKKLIQTNNNNQLNKKTIQKILRKLVIVIILIIMVVSIKIYYIIL